eukprot:c24310_g1_i1.p1 GENE.c24310_g1_i1~~c24310_g1_i1.p1  ORF type:complete len:201 (-),score=70.43 c24310_g1_i1:89-691(-)
MATETQFDATVKILLVGDSAVGKSSLLLRFSDNSFTPSFITTIGIDFKIRTIDADGKRIKLQVWDTAGQERFKTITTAYFRGAMGVLLLYDITREESFTNIESWMLSVRQNAPVDVQLVLVANKCDLEAERKITKARGEALAKQYNIPFFETSAKTSQNVEAVFTKITKLILANTGEKVLSPSGPQHFPKEEQGKKSSCC